jgi:hypothetical protein
VKLPPVIGESAEPRTPENPVEPALITPAVADFGLTRTAMIATPITASRTVTIDAAKESDTIILHQPVTGVRAAPKIFVNAVPPAVSTLAVCALGESNTAMIATPITAINTVTIEVANSSLIKVVSLPAV